MAQNPELPRGGGLVGVAIRQPVFTTMLMIGLVVLGVFSFRRLAIDQFPDISIPIVSIQTVYPGASPEVVETEVTRKIEEVVNPIRGVDSINSTSLESASLIIVEFELGTDIDAASADVRSKIEQIRRELPETIDPPVVQQFDPSELPILSLALSSQTTPVGQLTLLADDQIRPLLEGINGVGRIQITGGLEREVHVVLDPRAMQGLNVSVNQVMAALQQQNVEMPAGRIDQPNRELLVRVQARIEKALDFAKVIVGPGVRLSQVARVEDTTEEQRSLALIDGSPAVGIDVLKVTGANTVAVADQVSAAVTDIQQRLPPGVKLEIVRDNSVMIRESVTAVQHELLIGALLTVLIVLIFLEDARATTITALSLPVSIISTFILLASLGFTLNILTLMALSLSIGIVIDDAIVVIENIVRHREQGMPAMEAAFLGTQRIFLAVMATTLTIVAVFVPVAFMGGIIGKFFFEFGLTIAWAVLVSLLVSFTLTPMLAAWWGTGETERESEEDEKRARGIWRAVAFARNRFNRRMHQVERVYAWAIAWALGHRKWTLLIAAVSFAAAIALFPFVGGAFMPEQDQGEFLVTLETPSDASFGYTATKARDIEKRLRTLPGVEMTYTTIGAGPTGTVTRGEILVNLLPRGERELAQEELMQRARALLRGMYNVEVSVLGSGPGLGGATKPLEIVIRGPRIEELQRLAAQVEASVSLIPGAIEVESTIGEPKPEVRLQIDIDKANDLGLNAASIAGTVQPLLAGRTATTWRDPSGEERDVVVRVSEAARTSTEAIAALPVAAQPARGGGAAAPAGGGAAAAGGGGGGAPAPVTIPLGQVAELVPGTSAVQIERRDLARVATVQANIDPSRSLSEVSADVTALIGRTKLPAGYSATMGGETEQLQETTGYVVESLFLAIVLIYLILASQFGSFIQPVAIMMSLPLSIVGVLVALLLTNDTLNMMSMIGVILLMGLVTKNAILLVDNANQRREEGAEINAALAAAGAARLRPILMTTLAMIFGMVPIAIGMGEGGEFRAPMARAVIGGLITSTLLTLIVVPVIYVYLERFGTWTVSKLRRARPEGAVAEQAGG